jgi:hypothetical protein
VSAETIGEFELLCRLARLKEWNVRLHGSGDHVKPPRQMIGQPRLRQSQLTRITVYSPSGETELASTGLRGGLRGLEAAANRCLRELEVAGAVWPEDEAA